MLARIKKLETDQKKVCLKPAKLKMIHCDFRMVPILEDDVADRKSFSCPLFQNSERSGDDNYVQDLDIPTSVDPDVWTMRGVALLCQKPKED